MDRQTTHRHDAGEDAPALMVARRAVEIRERLATVNAARFEPDLAMSLNNLAIKLSKAGEGGMRDPASAQQAATNKCLAQTNKSWTGPCN